MPFERDPKWSDSQWLYIRLWSRTPRAKRKELPEEALARGETRRSVEDIQEKRRLKIDNKEVWEE